MKLWLDAQLSPALAAWVARELEVDAHAVRDLGLREAKDHDIFFAAREHRALILTKDADFVRLLERHGAPPTILWLTSGNTSNARVRELLKAAWPRVVELLAAGETLIELQNLR